MSKISKGKIQKIKEDILSALYHNNLKSMFTNEIAEAVIRDEEFVKKLLLELKKDELVKEIKRSERGGLYSKWRRWTLSTKAHEAYKKLL